MRIRFPSLEFCFSTSLQRCIAATLLCSAVAAQAADPATPAPSGGTDAVTLTRIRDAALASDWAMARLTDLTDRIGPRLSGSPGAAAAVTQVADALRKLGMRVSLQPVKVPHWVRGAETAELVGYAGRPAGLTQRVVLTALGGSGATPASGLTADVLVVHSFDELQAHGAQARGRIVLFDVPFDPRLAESGLAGPAYSQAIAYRNGGPAAASRLGAVAAMVRSVGSADFRLPHTGATGWRNATPIPAAAVSAEDAMLMTRLAATGPLTMHVTLTPQTLPDADSFNVIADLTGREKPDEIVIVSGHLDSWDLGQGAIDDGAGVAGAMGVAETLVRLGLKPRRTLRIIAWMNEENGQRGANAYFDANRTQLVSHIAAIESDFGAGRPFGMVTSVPPEGITRFEPVRTMAQSLGAGILERRDALGTGDLSPLEGGGVPSFEPLVDGRSYFNYHHTGADTLDKVDPDNLRRHVAVMSLYAWYLAEMREPIGRAAVPKEH
ncbi:MAG: M20/M25/M40 family metallo-hydrolase [Herminiimonas sp.]|nr:M20/M25/M40 family metallo-hydrolase [Herminiimonas sp.]